MGQHCAKVKKVPIIVEIDIPAPSYKSQADGLFSKFEDTYNLFKYLQAIEYLHLLTNYTTHPLGDERSLSKVDKTYREELSMNFYQVFLENKILHSFSLYTLAGENEALSANFKEVFLKMYDWILKRINKMAGTKVQNLKKLHLIALGMQYCSSSLRGKVKIMYNLFLGDNELFVQSPDFREFILTLLIIPSSVSINLWNDLHKMRPEDYPEKEEGFALNLMDAFEPKDINRALDKFMADFFKGKKELTFNEFEENFAKFEFGWIFSPAGVRAFLEKNNDR